MRTWLPGLLAAAFLALLAPHTPAADTAADTPAERLDAARQRWLQGNYAEARAAYEELRKEPSTAANAAIGVSATLRAEGDYEKALAALDDAVKATPANADLLAERADLRYTLGRWDDALEDVKAALATQDDHFLARWVRARIIRDRGDQEAASQEMRWFVRAYTQASNDDKDITDSARLAIVGQAGTEHARWNNLPRQFSFILEEVYGDILKRDPNYWMAENFAGRMLLEKYNKADAEDAFDKALKINPKAVEALVGKGLLCLQTFDLKEAEQYAERALAVNAKHPEALRLRADLDLIAGDVGAATRRLLRAKAINPKDETVLGRLAACYLLTKQAEPFAALVKDVQSFNAKPAVFYHALGETLDDRKLWKQSEEYLKKAAELRPNDPAPRAALGMLFLRLGREDEARVHLDAAYKADPFNVRVFNSRKVLNHLDKYATLETAHYIIRYDPQSEKVLAHFIADYIEQIHHELKTLFHYEPPGKILIEVFNNHEMFSGRTVALPDLHTIGASTGRLVTMTSPHAKDLKRLFNWSRVIKHELVHVFNLTQSDFQVPHWLTEGLAVRNEGSIPPPDWLNTLRERIANGSTFNLDTIMLGFVRPKNPTDWSQAYFQGFLYVEYAAKTHGEACISQLLEAYKSGSDTGLILRNVLGVDKAEFEAGYRKYIADVVKAASGTNPPKLEPPMTLAQLEAAHKADTDDATVAARLAEKSLQAGKTAEARKLADGVLAKQPHHPRAVTVKARLLSRDQDDAGAQALLDAALAAAPEDHRLLLARGKQHAAAKEWEPAATLFERGRKAAPLEGDWLDQLAKAYAALNRTKELINVLSIVAVRDYDTLPVRLQLAKLHQEAKDHAGMEKWAREILFIDVKNEEGRTLLLEALRAQGKNAEADKIAAWYE